MTHGGGVHLVLEVDVRASLEERLDDVEMLVARGHNECSFAILKGQEAGHHTGRAQPNDGVEF